MFVREPREFESVWRGARFVTTHQFEQGRVQVPVCVRADMREASDPRLGVFKQGNRASMVAHGP